MKSKAQTQRESQILQAIDVKKRKRTARRLKRVKKLLKHNIVNPLLDINKVFDDALIAMTNRARIERMS